MKIKTSEATGLQLDWGLAKVMGAKRIIVNWRGVWVEDEEFKVGDDCRGWVCHTDPAVCMELIACEYGKVWKVEAIPRTPTPTALAMGFSSVGADVTKAYGKNLAEAVARCVISMRLGDEFECPSELGVMS